MRSQLGTGWVRLAKLIKDRVALSVGHQEANEAVRLRAWSAVGNPPARQAVKLISAS